MIAIKYLFRLIWNRRKMNFLMIAEIFISFLVIFVLVQSLVKFAFYYSEPLGFNYQNVWNLEINLNNLNDDEARPEMEMIKNELRAYPEIINFSEAYNIPYTSMAIQISVEYEDRTLKTNMLLADDNYEDVLEIELIAGRWFDNSDDVSNYESVIINKKLKEEIFGEEDAIGKFLGQKENQRIVIGVIEPIKKQGELNAYGKIIFKRINPNDPESWIGRNILMKMKPGTGIDFEESLLRRLTSISRNFTLEIIQMERMRERSFAKYSAAAYVFGFISLFLVINVSLGLFGVLWYNINFRKSEIGIRRSYGSTAKNIYSQIIGETMVLSTVSLILGSFIVLQLKILITNWLRTDIFYASYFISVFVIYTVTAVCAFYPSKLAAEIEPAEALHDE